MSKTVEFSAEVREKVFRGVEILARAVGGTLGPKGRNVAIQGPGRYALVTKDGVTVAQHIELEDPFEDLGVRLALNAAMRTAEVAGDGTTTSTVLMYAILCEGQKLVDSGIDPIQVKRGMDAACEDLLTELDKLARPCETFEAVQKVGSLSANGDSAIGTLLAQAMSRVGAGGIITVEDSVDGVDSLEFVDGMEFQEGYLSQYFVTDKGRMVAELENPYVLLVDRELTTVKRLIPLLEKLMKSERPMLIVAPGLREEALANLIVNTLNGKIRVVAVNAPGGSNFKEHLEDIAILTGGLVISEDLGRNLEEATLESLGQCDKVIVSNSSTTVLNGHGDQELVSGRVQQLTTQIVPSLSKYQEMELKDRIAKLSGGVAVLKVGGPTDVELRERKARVEDALYAVRAAVDSGVVPGGGMALLRLGVELDQEDRLVPKLSGEKVVTECLSTPIKKMLENAGSKDGFNRVLNAFDVALIGPEISYNILTKTFDDMYVNGIIDPVSVTKNALINAVSAASMLLTMDCAIVDTKSGDDK